MDLKGELEVSKDPTENCDKTMEMMLYQPDFKYPTSDIYGMMKSAICFMNHEQKCIGVSVLVTRTDGKYQQQLCPR